MGRKLESASHISIPPRFRMRAVCVDEAQRPSSGSEGVPKTGVGEFRGRVRADSSSRLCFRRAPDPPFPDIRVCRRMREKGK